MENVSQKKIRENDDNILDTEENEKISDKCYQQYLTYDVLRIIFKYLNGMELSNASMVCRSWLEAANNEKRTRGPIYVIKSSTNCLPNKKSVENIKTEIIKNLPIKPALGLFFTVSTSYSIPFNGQDCHCKLLPRNCYSATLCTSGIVIDDKEIEANFQNTVGVFLPDVPNVYINVDTFSTEDLCTKNRVIRSVEQCSEKITNSLNISQSTCDNSKCLLLFCDFRGRPLTVNIAESLRKRYKAGELSVWGGVAEQLYVCTPKDSKHYRCGKYTFCTVITLVGSVKTFSIIVYKNHKTKEQVEERLMLFKKHVVLKKHSMGFMFACCARGQSMFHECNVESSIFKKLFPEVPLVGCFGDGEFGENTVPETKSDSKNESSTSKKTGWYNEMSSIFLILTYG